MRPYFSFAVVDKSWYDSKTFIMSCEIIPPVEFLPSALDTMATDHDGVMADIKSLVTATFNTRFGTNHTADEIRYWDVVVDWALALGMKKDEAVRVQLDMWYDKDLLIQAKPVPGAVEFMCRAYELGHQIPIFSSRPPDWYRTTWDWYSIHMPFIPPQNIHVGIQDIPSEFIKCFRLNSHPQPIRLYLEDAMKHAQNILEQTAEVTVILVSTDTTLDWRQGDRLLRIAGKSTEVPNLWPVYKAFFGSLA